MRTWGRGHLVTRRVVNTLAIVIAAGLAAHAETGDAAVPWRRVLERRPAQEGLQPGRAGDARRDAAEQLMRRALEAVREAREKSEAQRAQRGAPGERPETRGLDGGRAALIGVEVSPLMTTLGSLESKRLATDTRWAGALVRQFADHGIGAGATVLASFSGSFPGLNLAVMAACRAMDLRLVAISSVTASTWGANEPGFTWPEMEAVVVRAGVMPVASAAISVGGTRDAGRDLTDEGRSIARRIQREAAATLGARVIEVSTLDDAIAARQQVYEAALSGTRPSAYVNVGGNHASLGGARAAFRREEGWLPERPAGSSAGGVMEAWMARGVPALNLLDVKALARAWGMEPYER